MRTILQPGLHHDVPHEVYHSDPAEQPSLSGSVAVTLAHETPRHAFFTHCRLGKDQAPKETSENKLDFGQVCHSLILGAGQEIAIGEWDNWMTKDAKAFRALCGEEGKTPVLRHVYERAETLRFEFFRQLKAAGLNDEWGTGHSEVTIVWTKDSLFYRCRPDRLSVSPGMTTIFDLKVSGSADPEFAAKNIYDMGYDLKACHLAAGVGAALPDSVGRTRVVYLYIEDKHPFCMTAIEMTGEYKAIGDVKYERALKRWAKGMKSGEWPAWGSEIIRVEPPKYATFRELGGAL